MSEKKRDVVTTKVARHHTQPISQEDTVQPELCRCLPPSAQKSVRRGGGDTDNDNRDILEEGPLVLTTPSMYRRLYTHLQMLLPRTTSLSLILLHVAQIENPSLSSEEGQLQYQRRFHVTQEILAQIVTNVRRSIRESDQMLLEEGVGAAILFPDVDEQGLQNILERIYRNICLLRAETIVPPLERMTTIVLGGGSYAQETIVSTSQSSKPGIEALLTRAERITHRLLLRPALTTSLWETMPAITSTAALRDIPSMQSFEPEEYQERHEVLVEPALSAIAGQGKRSADTSTPIPFLHLPTALSSRLKHLLPYSIARQFRCVPVGSDHHKLTVAMANPEDSTALNYLSKLTGMTIFPVSCDDNALANLLSERW